MINDDDDDECHENVCKFNEENKNLILSCENRKSALNICIVENDAIMFKKLLTMCINHSTHRDDMLKTLVSCCVECCIDHTYNTDLVTELYRKILLDNPTVTSRDMNLIIGDFLVWCNCLLENEKNLSVIKVLKQNIQFILDNHGGVFNFEIDHSIKFGETSLYYACHKNHLKDIVRSLLAHNAAVNGTRTNVVWSDRPLSIATQLHCDEIVSLLLEYNADVNIIHNDLPLMKFAHGIKNENSKTGKIYELLQQHTAKLLEQNGTDVTRTDNKPPTVGD